MDAIIIIIIMDNFHKLTTISISHENYLILKGLGSTGDSFNDVLTQLLKNRMLLKGDSKVGAQDHPIAEKSKGGCSTTNG
jgi:predicted CopG family antitoxin